MPRHGPPPAAPRAVDESMTLLNELQRRPLDPGYAEAAARRARQPAARRHRPLSVGVALVMAAVLGLGVAAAALTLRQPTSGDRQARRLLEDQVRERKEAVERLEAANAETSAQIAALQESALSSEDPALLEATRRWSIAACTAPVTGPGLRVVLSDAPVAAEDPNDLDARVQDVDLQVLVNGLWAAGAEAIAVNAQRVGPTTAIRSAGSAVLVDLVPLVGPYTVEAIGDAGDLQANLARSSAGQHVAMLHATYGIAVEMTSAAELTLGPGVVVLRQASVPEDALVAAGLADAGPEADVPGSGPDDEPDDEGGRAR